MQLDRVPQGRLKVFEDCIAAHLQSSLRDFSTLESLPRTASWAKFSRPFGTDVCFHARLQPQSAVDGEDLPGNEVRAAREEQDRLGYVFRGPIALHGGLFGEVLV